CLVTQDSARSWEGPCRRSMFAWRHDCFARVRPRRGTCLASAPGCPPGWRARGNWTPRVGRRLLTRRFVVTFSRHYPRNLRRLRRDCSADFANGGLLASKADSGVSSRRSGVAAMPLKRKALRRRALRLQQDERHPLFIFSLTGEELLAAAD